MLRAPSMQPAPSTQPDPAHGVQRTMCFAVFSRDSAEAFVEAAAKLLVADDPARLVVLEPLLDGRDETRLRGQAVERFGGEQDGGRFPVLRDDER